MCVCVCVCAHTHACMCVLAYCVCVCESVRVCACAHMRVYVCLPTLCLYLVCMCAPVYYVICIQLYVCFVCLYLHFVVGLTAPLTILSSPNSTWNCARQVSTVLCVHEVECSPQPHCSHHGQCVAGRCRCHLPWSGKSCDSLICPGNCNGHGLCLEGEIQSRWLLTNFSFKFSSD